MHQINWLSRIATSLIDACPFNKGVIRLWAVSPVDDDTDALGLVLMGGEL